MAYRIEGADIVLDGWENGISDNPYKGINDMRGVNIISIPGEASVSFAPSNQIMPSFTGSITSADPSTNIITAERTTGSMDSYQAVVFTGASLPAGITAGKTYWVSYIDQYLTTWTFTIYDNCRLSGSAVDITGNGTGSIASTNMGEITYFEKATGVALDINGRVWDKRQGTKYAFLGNKIISSSNGNGICWYKGYLFVFMNSRISYCAYGLTGYTTPVWVDEWDPSTGAASVGTDVFNTAVGTTNVHEGYLSRNLDKMYITDSNYIASLGTAIDTSTGYPKTFDPTTPATYIWLLKALILPKDDIATCIEELGGNLIIGGTLNCIYTWNKVAISYNDVMKIADNYTYHLLTVNTNTYIFAGKRGRIYLTNGSQANLYTKIPDHISGVEPIYTWKNCCYNKNQIYFGITAQNNQQVAITSYAGLWAVDITTNSLRCVNLMSDVLGSVTAIFANITVDSGFGLEVAWKNGTSYGIDNTSYTPYSTYVAYIDTDIIPIGKFLIKRTLSNIELKLAKGLSASSGVKVSYRTSRTGAYVQVGETTVAGTIGDFYSVNFDQCQWIQFRIELKGTVSLYELRLS